MFIAKVQRAVLLPLTSRPYSVSFAMYLKTTLLGALSLFVHSPDAVAQTLILTAEPQNATLYRVKPQDNSLIALGTGSAKFELKKNDPNTVVVRLDGYREVQRSFPKEDKYQDKNFILFLTKRIVKITAQPFDANIFVNGEMRGQRALELDVEEGQPTTVEVKKRGFVTQRRNYRFERKGEMPPLTDRINLTDRQVSITTAPSNAEIFLGGNKLGSGSADIAVPNESCVNVSVTRSGFVPVERNYCNKENSAPPPLDDRVQLTSRVVSVNSSPDARIFVNEKLAGTGSFVVRIPESSCINVRVEQEGFLTYRRDYCAQANRPEAPIEDAVTLNKDAAYDASVQTDQANRRIGLEVSPTRAELAAWKLIASIVMNTFDVIDNSDAETGYLRTAWATKKFDNGSLIRTRVIISRVSADPLRYSIQLVSEKNTSPGASVKDDEGFEPWNRVLKMYDGLVTEIQTRIK